MSALQQELAQRLEAHGVEASGEQVGQLAGYLALLRQWNAKMNLTALESGDASLDRLIVEPALAAAHISPRASHLMDIGSGGGSPAIPLRIMRPGLRLTMIEVRARKSVFLREVVRHLALEAASVQTFRFEDVVLQGRVGLVDVVSVRAVRLEPRQLTLCADSLTPAGQMLWFLSSAQDVPAMVPALFSERTLLPLVSHTASRLLVLRRSLE